MITEYSDYNCIDELEGSFDEVETFIRQKRKDGWEGTYVDYDSFDGGARLVLYKRREETDEEYTNRIKQKKQQEQLVRDNKRKLYEELKKEFEENK